MDWYSWLLALHIISIIAWMAGLLYLPRLYVYHCQQVPGSAASETFKVMERRLLRFIMNPAMIASFVFGSVVDLAAGRVGLVDGLAARQADPGRAAHRRPRHDGELAARLRPRTPTAIPSGFTGS